MTEDDERGPADREAPPELINLVSAPDNATDPTAKPPQFELDLGLDTTAAEDPFWRETGLSLIEELAATGIPFTAPDLSKRGLGEPPHANWWGMLFGTAHRLGIIESIGATVSSRASRAGGICRVWVGTAEFRQGAA